MTASIDHEVVPMDPNRPASKSSRLARRVRQAIVTAVVLGIVACIVLGAVALVSGSWQVNPVLSGSMRPGFSIGGIVISERIPVKELAVRDVIVFDRPGNASELVVHRIVSIEKGLDGKHLIRTMGDANPIRDPWTLMIDGKYAYKVRWALPLVGYVAVAYENHRGVTLLVAGLIVLLAVALALRAERRRAKSLSPPTAPATAEPALEVEN